MARTATGTAEEREAARRLPQRTWWAIVVVGLAGQIGWAAENLYLNLFVYDTITDNPAVIAAMVALSAASATLATLLIGPLSDRWGRRRVFITIGYVAWGATTMLFGLITVDGVAAVIPVASAALAAATAVILLDCLMSFLGASANDAAFNAWVTDVTSSPNRGRVESVLAAMPLMATLVVFATLDDLTRQGQWRLFFVVVGVVVMASGLLALALIRDVPGEPRQPDGMLHAVLHGLRPAAVRDNPRLYLALSGMMVLGISISVFLPYLIIYLQRYLRIEAYALVLAVVLTGSAVVSILGGRVIDRVGKVPAMLPLACVYLLGLLVMTFARQMIPVMIGGLILMSGYMLTAAAIGAAVRDYTPLDRVGMVQGLRMIAYVLVPMVLGPFIGAAVITGADEYYEDLGQLKQVPTPAIFLAAAAVILLLIVPIRALRRRT